jgi:dipeptidyl aminopeptidase/acylaminoacyl peptidase
MKPLCHRRADARRRTALIIAGLVAAMSGAPCWAQTPLPILTDLQPVTFPPDANPPDLTSDGRWLAYGVSDDASPAERLVYVRDMQTGATRSLTDRESPDGWATAPRWSPNGQWLAFFVKRDGKPRLALWDRMRDRITVGLHVPTPAAATGVSWLENGDGLLVVAEPPEASKKPVAGTPDRKSDLADGKSRVKVTVWRSIAAKRVEAGESHATTGTGASARLINDGYDYPISNVSPTHDVWQVSVRSEAAPTARWVLRGTGIDIMAASPDGRWVALLGNRRVEEMDDRSVIGVGDLFLAPLVASTAQPPVSAREGIWMAARGQQMAPVTTGIYQEYRRRNLSWSPDSSALAYVTSGAPGSGDIFVVDVAAPGGQSGVRNLTAGASLASPRRAERDPQTQGRFSFGNRYPSGAPLWTADSRGLVRAAGDDIWYIDAKSGAVRNLTTNSPHLSFTAAPGFVNPSGVRQVVGDREAIVVHAVDANTLREGLWRVRLADGRITRLVEDARSLRIAEAYGDFSDDMSVMMTAASSYNVPVEIWAASRADMSDFRAVTSWNRHDVAWVQRVRRTDLRWTTPAGRPAGGVLLMPELPEGAPRPPVLVSGYPEARMTARVDSFGVTARVEPFAALSRGYAVFLLDLPIPPYGVYGPEGPLMEVVRAVEAGMDALVETRLVDEKRAAVHGFSYGGLMVNSLMTHSRRFAAGIAGAGLSDLVSAANGGPTGMQYFELAQGRMGATLWAEPQRYISNSPVFFLDRVTTPLLLYHGMKDTHVPIFQTEEMYRGLARLGQDVTLLRYHEVGHGFYDADESRDLWSRILDWLDTRLKRPVFSSVD